MKLVWGVLNMYNELTEENQKYFMEKLDEVHSGQNKQEKIYLLTGMEEDQEKLSKGKGHERT